MKTLSALAMVAGLVLATTASGLAAPRSQQRGWDSYARSSGSYRMAASNARGLGNLYGVYGIDFAYGAPPPRGLAHNLPYPDRPYGAPDRY